MPKSENGDLSEKFQRLVESVDVANLLTEPLISSIEELLRISAVEIKSGEASVLVLDSENGDGDLRFLAAIGEVAEQLMDVRVPAGKGIAGFVLSSGQPMAVSDVGEEQSFYAEVDKTTGYSTQSILATPLRHRGEVIGVLEYINRRGEPPFEPFTPAEMDKAAVYAEAVASLVNAYESARMFRALGEKTVAADSDLDVGAIREWLQQLRSSPEHKEMMDLAVLVREIASRGKAERQMCREILESILKYSEDKSDISFLSL
ncbi:MAG: GAF domain-containing protein [Acidobacteriota bacterium]